MIFAEKLYALTARDVGLPWASTFNKKFTTAPLATSVTYTFTLSTKRWSILRNMSAEATPGAAQVMTRFRWGYGTPEVTGDNFVIISAIGPGAVATRTPHNWQGEVWIPPNWPINAVATFDAGANANELIFSLFGFNIPVGTLQVERP